MFKTEQPVVFLTGITSFTGTRIAEAFLNKGWSVVGFCSSPACDYQNQTCKKKRLDFLTKKTLQKNQFLKLEFSLRAEKNQLSEWLRKHENELPQRKIWIHHHHWMENFRSFDYDSKKADSVCLSPLSHLAEALKSGNFEHILVSGSFFEPGEGNHHPLGVPSASKPYGLSKHRVWMEWKSLGEKFDFSLCKIVIPNPVGVLEGDDRLTHFFLKSRAVHSQGEVEINSLKSETDFIFVEDLANFYVSVAEGMVFSKVPLPVSIYRPSGWVCSIKDWLVFLDTEIHQKKFQLCPVTLKDLGGEMTFYSNPSAERIECNWKKFLEDYCQYLSSLI